MVPCFHWWPWLLKPKGHITSVLTPTPPKSGLGERPFQGTGLSVPYNSYAQGSQVRPLQGSGLTPLSLDLQGMSWSKPQPDYLDKVQGCFPAKQQENFTVTVYSMAVRTIEESIGVEPTFFYPRTGNFRLTNPEISNGLLDLMEAITSTS